MAEPLTSQLLHPSIFSIYSTAISSIVGIMLASLWKKWKKIDQFITKDEIDAKLKEYANTNKIELIEMKIENVHESIETIKDIINKITIITPRSPQIPDK